LEEKGVENGRLEAEWLLARVLDVSRLDLYLQFDRPIRREELEGFKSLLLRRASREPLQYVLGKTSFRELELGADTRALIPRPETEGLVEEVLGWARTKGTDLVGLDIGTGGGAIALSLSKEGPFRQMVATDPSEEALELAEENARAQGLEERIEFRRGALFDPLHEGERFDLVVSNPPYIPDVDRPTLQPEVREWEPNQALFAGPEGLDVLLPMARGVSRFMRPGGLFAVEIGLGQGPRVAQELEGTGAFKTIEVRPDLSGRGRFVVGVASL
jgi:release factor glutamine methyltransferase